MATTLDLTYGATTHRLTDLGTLLATSGDGPAPAHRLSERGPQQHGASDLGYRLDPRTLQYVFVVTGKTPAELRAKRQAFNAALRYLDTAAQLTTTWDDKVQRAIDVVLAGIEVAPVGLHAVKLGVTLTASDPTYYDPAGESVSFLGPGGGATWTIPQTTPLFVGGSEFAGDRTYTYDGDVAAYPVVRIAGPLTSPVISNRIRHPDGTIETVTLDLTGTTIGADTALTIDCRAGAKTVVDDAGTNQIAALVEATSDLATFRIAPTENQLQVSGTGATSAARIDLVWLTRYIGS